MNNLYLLDLFLLFLSSCCWVCADDLINVATDSSSECSPRSCGALSQVSYPFGWEDSHCGASPLFLLSNCTNGASPLWPGFNATYIDNNPATLSPAPAIIRLNLTTDGRYNHVSLSWYKYISSYSNSSYHPQCEPLPLDKPSIYGFPAFISFLKSTASTNSFDDFQFSINNIVMLFNCSNISAIGASNYLIKNSPYCSKFYSSCNGSSTSSFDSCYVYNGGHELDLNSFMANYSCTHFQFFIVENINLDLDKWDLYALQLTWSNPDLSSALSCQQCENHNGSCGFSNDTNIYDFKCFCSASSGDYCGQTNINKRNTIIYIVITVVTASAILILLFLSGIRYCSNKQLTYNDLQPDSMYDRPVQVPYKSVRDFKDKVGEGGNGVVYRGIMKMQQLDEEGISRTVDVAVAIKVLDPDSKHSSTQFVSEVSTIGNIRHLNVVKLLGFCTEKSHRILIYEFVSNGSLDRWLFRNRDGVNVPILDWKQRYAIAVGVARGLCYLHEECRHRIVHCDIKPQNILLDEHMSPKIADFGLAKLIARRRGDVGCGSVVTMAKGTPGYVAPEFWMGGESRLTTKFDVYSYGMVLLELISGRPNFNGCETRSSFPVQAFEATRREDFQILLDARLNASDLSMDDLQKLRTATMVALWCVQDSPNLRPSMKEVMQFLEGSLGVPEECPPPPAILRGRTAGLCSTSVNLPQSWNDNLIR